MQETKKPEILGPIGEALGGFFGFPGIGRAAGSWLGQVTGIGDYKISKNTVVPTDSTAAQAPMFKSSRDGMEVCHREFLGSVMGSDTFTSVVYPINVGINNTFPWLSRVAENFEEYDMLGLLFQYVPTSGSSALSQALGTVIMSTQYNVNEPNFSSKREMEAHEFCTSAVPNMPFTHPIECDPKLAVLPNHFVRTGPVSDDKKFYDIGNLTVAAVGTANAQSLGDIWVTYHVKLRKPRLYKTLHTQDFCLVSTPSVINSDLMGLQYFSSQKIWANSLNVAIISALTPSATYDYPVFMYPDNIVFTRVGLYELSLVVYAAGGTPSGSVPGFAVGSNITGYNGTATYPQCLMDGWLRTTTTSTGQVRCVFRVKTAGLAGANTVTISGGWRSSTSPYVVTRLRLLDPAVNEMPDVAI